MGWTESASGAEEEGLTDREVGVVTHTDMHAHMHMSDPDVNTWAKGFTPTHMEVWIFGDTEENWDWPGEWPWIGHLHLWAQFTHLVLQGLGSGHYDQVGLEWYRN